MVKIEIASMVCGIGRILCCALLVCSMCDSVTPDDDALTLVRQDYLGTELRTDGYYYNNTSNPKYWEIFILSRNGVLSYESAVDTTAIVQQEELFKNGQWYSQIKDDKLLWGLFEINGQSIIWEKWDPSSGGGPLPAYRWSGSIINDTMFEISNVCRVSGSGCVAINRPYHFKQLTPKPDSISKFVQ
jgi:hypothetical protein